MFPCLHAVSDRHALQGSAFDFLIDGLGCVVRVENDDRLAPVALEPCPFDASQDFIAVMIKEQDANLIQAGQVHGSGAVVKNLDAEKAFIRLFGRKRQLKAPLVSFTFQGTDLSVNFPSQVLILLALFRRRVCPALPALSLRRFP